MAALFEAYITNLGKYNEGELVGETLKFPTTTEEVQALLKRIGVDDVRYEEFFITSFDGDMLGLYDYLTEYENLDELNHLACLLSELEQSDLEKFEAVIDSGEHTSSVADLINLTQLLHDKLTDDLAGDLAFERAEQLLLDVIDDLFQLPQRNRAFLARLHQTVEQLLVVVRLPGAIALDQHKRHALHRLVGGKAFSAVETFTPATDAGTLVRRTGVHDLAVFKAAKWALHPTSPL